VTHNNPLKKSLRRRGMVSRPGNMSLWPKTRRATASNRGFGRERNAVIRPQGPDVARMYFFNGLITVEALKVPYPIPLKIKGILALMRLMRRFKLDWNRQWV